MFRTPSAGLRARSEGADRHVEWRARRRTAWLAVALVLAGVFVACGDEDTGRRFANEPLPSLTVPSPTATFDPAQRPTPPHGTGGGEPSALALGDLLDVRGAPDRIYFVAGGAVWHVRADGQEQRRLHDAAPDLTIRAIAPAPGVAAGSVAALLSAPVAETGTPAASPESSPPAATPVAAARSTTTLLILDAEGHELRRLDGVEAVLGAGWSGGATPQPVALTWSPQGDQLLVTFAPGGVVVVPRAGDPALLIPSGEEVPVFATSSPAGDAVAYLAAEPETGLNRLYLAEIDGGVPSTPSPLAPGPDVVGDVAAAAWLPDGSGLLYVDAAAPPAVGGDLYRISRDGRERQLVASAGRAAPVARITDFAVAPDGSAVAYAISIPDPSGGGLRFHSLWVQALDGGQAFLVPTAADQTVTAIWWASGGLLWRATADPAAADGAFTIERLDPTGSETAIFAYEPEVATPAASPAAGAATPAAASPNAATEGE
jgi:hypothetical protein